MMDQNYFMIFAGLALLATVAQASAQDAMFVDSTGNVGVGTNTPAAPLHVVRPDSAQVLVEDTTGTAGQRVPFKLVNNGKTRFIIDSGTDVWSFDNTGAGSFDISKVGTGSAEFRVFGNGDLRVTGTAYAVNHVNTSSRSVKTDFSPVDPGTILAKMGKLDVSQWRYKIEPTSSRHIGPMAEDFQAAFGLGDGKHISTVDSAGIAFAAIKGLQAQNEALKQQLDELQEQVAELKAQTK